MNVWHDSNGVGPDLVLLHGWGMNAAVWQPLMNALCERYRVTRIELPGHGASPHIASPGKRDLDAWAEACLAVAPDQACWVGWSLGGLVAQSAALIAPQRIRKLGLVASTPSFVKRPNWNPALELAVFEQFAAALLADPTATLKRFLGLQVKGAEHARDVLRQLNDALAERPAATAEGLAQGLRLLREGDLRESLSDLNLPVHWLLGQRDTLIPVALEESLQRLRPHDILQTIPGAGHAPWLSHPADSLAWVENCCG